LIPEAGTEVGEVKGAITKDVIEFLIVGVAKNPQDILDLCVFSLADSTAATPLRSAISYLFQEIIFRESGEGLPFIFFQ
jgi:hypothetical protein